jgi:hypothetical protein
LASIEEALFKQGRAPEACKPHAHQHHFQQQWGVPAPTHARKKLSIIWLKLVLFCFGVHTAAFEWPRPMRTTDSAMRLKRFKRLNLVRCFVGFAGKGGETVSKNHWQQTCLLLAQCKAHARQLELRFLLWQRIHRAPSNLHHRSVMLACELVL